MPTVQVRSLMKIFGGVRAVDDLSFTVADGELVTLLGPSGCGKTTTLNILAGFETPTAGEILIGDRVISSAERGVIVPSSDRNLGMVFQSYALWPHYTVFEHIAFGLRMRRVPRKEIAARVARALSLVRLEGFETRYPGQLSGGQQQRVALARAIVYDPSVLLLDEPLSNLDAALRETMRVELRELHERTGITTVYVTHDQSEAMAISDRVIVMNRGRIEQQGTPREIYEGPATAFVAEFIGETNLLKGTVTTSGAQGEVELELGQRLVCPLPGGVGVGEQVLLSIRPEDLEIGDKPGPPGATFGPGKVTRVLYLGNAQECWVAVREHSLRFQTKASLAVTAGDEVYLTCNPRRIAILRGKGGTG